MAHISGVATVPCRPAGHSLFSAMPKAGNPHPAPEPVPPPVLLARSFGMRTPVNFRKAITKHRRDQGRGGRGGRKSRPKNADALPYPTLYDGMELKGVLSGMQVFLYDLKLYKYLRDHRGYFGSLNRLLPREPGQRTLDNGYDEELHSFPPGPSVHPIAMLSLYEAYFLVTVGNCLTIYDDESGLIIPPETLAGRFTDITSLFPYFFAAYHHFRLLKYVVASGVKFGTDFLLYEYGPMKTHSIYMVYIVVPGIRDPSMALVDTLQRVANAAKKDALLVRVTADGVFPEDLRTYDGFKRLRITEIIVRRSERAFDKPVEICEIPAYRPPGQANIPQTPSPRPAWNETVRPIVHDNLQSTFYGGDFRHGMIRNRDINGKAFQHPVVHLGVRRFFRGRFPSVRPGMGRGHPGVSSPVRGGPNYRMVAPPNFRPRFPFPPGTRGAPRMPLLTPRGRGVFPSPRHRGTR